MSKFITNRDGNTMRVRVSERLRGAYSFDVLTGYFNISGFDGIARYIESGCKVRVLVGMGIGRELLRVQENLTEEYKTTEISKEVYDNTLTFLDMLVSGDLEVRGHPGGVLHSKMYIFKGGVAGDSVIVGSSNLTSSGLGGNIELNVELDSPDDVEEARQIFEELWRESVDLGDAYLDMLEYNTWVCNEPSPRDVYMKFLYEYFRHGRGFVDPDYKVKDEVESYKYQIDGAVRASNIIDKHGGVFISDVVGLGKTYTTCMLLGLRGENTLILCPPHLVEEWREVVDLFGFNFRCEVESTGKLDKVIDRDILWNIKNVVVDESHSFKNSRAQKYGYLQKICNGRNVILLSATPRNNLHRDIENQLRLFQKDSSSVLGGRSLSEYFKSLRRELSVYPIGSKEYRDVSRSVSNRVRDDILVEVMVRRTRQDISEIYVEDMERQGLVFPDVEDPVPVEYEIDDGGDSFSCAYDLTLEEFKGVKFEIYNINKYLDKSKSGNVSGFMRTMFIKRFESSMGSFISSLDRLVDMHRMYLEYIEDGYIPYIDKNVSSGDIEDYLYGKTELESFDLIPVSMVSREYIINVKRDFESLLGLKEVWSEVDNDLKWDKFKDTMITDEILKTSKVIIFTEYKDTAEYLYRKMEECAEFKGRVMKFTGEDNTKSRRYEVRESFDYNVPGDGGYDILITTDVLSEGINLHKSRVVLNYDIPWNPTTVIQRVGRINRVGTPYNKLYIYNMMPSDKTEEATDMKAKIVSKLHAFQDTLGEDARYLSEDEIVGSKGLADSIFIDYDEDLEGISVMALQDKYKKELSDYLSGDTDREEYLRGLPLRVRSGKLNYTCESSGVLSVFRRGEVFKYYYSDGRGSRELNFVEMIDILRSSVDDKYIGVGPEYFRNVNLNIDACYRSEYIESVKVRGGRVRVPENLKCHLDYIEDTSNDEKWVTRFRSLLSSGDIPKIDIDELEKDISQYEVGEVELEDFKRLLSVDVLSLVGDTREDLIDSDGGYELLLSLELF